MRTAYVIKAHISAEGTIVLDEPAVLAPGPVLVIVLPLGDHPPAGEGYTQAERDELSSRLASIAALPGPQPPDDGLTAKDARTILYGSHAGMGDVR